MRRGGRRRIRRRRFEEIIILMNGMIDDIAGIFEQRWSTFWDHQGVPGSIAALVVSALEHETAF